MRMPERGSPVIGVDWTSELRHDRIARVSATQVTTEAARWAEPWRRWGRPAQVRPTECHIGQADISCHALTNACQAEEYLRAQALHTCRAVMRPYREVQHAARARQLQSTLLARTAPDYSSDTLDPMHRACLRR